MISNLIASFRKHRENRRRYRAAIAEIETLTQRDLADLRADPAQMAHEAYRNIFGKAAA